MVEVIKIYLNHETLVTLEDHFEEDKKETLHQFFYTKLRDLAKTSKLSDAKRAVVANFIDKDGNVDQKSFPYKEVKLDHVKIKSDPSWRPKNLEKEETALFELKVGEKTHNHLSNYCKIHLVRITEFNKSIPRKDGKVAPNYKELDVPTCFEEIIHQGLEKPITDLLGLDAEQLFDKENEDILKAEAEEKEIAEADKKVVQK